jgi:hypothetical protein
MLEAALAALELEARNNPDAAVLWRIIEGDNGWGILEACNHFEGCVRSRPALMSVLLKELSAALPVPKSLLQ